MYPLKSTQWLASHLHDENLIVLDASVEKVLGREPVLYDNFMCIDGARRFDPVTRPDAVILVNELKRLGVNDTSIVLVYDNQGIYSAARAWWLLKCVGCEQVFVLDGGLPAWLEAQQAVSTGYANCTQQGDFTGHPEPALLSDATEVLKAIANADVTIIDARSKGRFRGESAEPRPGLRPGHIPGSVNIHFASLQTNDRMKSEAELSDIFAGELVNKRQRIVATCGSGITACIVLLAASIAGYRNLSLYDGSWSEWGRDPRLPVETGPSSG